MFTTDAGIKVYENDDLVTVGKGTTKWEITLADPERNRYNLRSLKTGTRKYGVSAGNLTIDPGYAAAQELDRAYQAKVAAEEAAQQEERVVEHTTYQKAVLFALNALGKHVYAGTVTKAKKARTRKLNLRQKASRKANR